MFLIMAVSLYTVRVIIQTLSVQDYGIYGAVGGIVLSFGFISGVLTNASQRYFSYELGKGKDGRLRETFSTIIITYIVISVFILLLAETVGLWFLSNKLSIPSGRENAALWVYQFAILSFFVTLMTNPFQALLIAYEKMNLYAYISILDVILKLSIVYVLLIFDIDKLKLYSVLMFLACLLTNSVYIVYCRRKYSETRIMWKIDKSMLKSIFSYSSWTLIGTLSSMCNTQGMNLTLNVFFGPVANAAYSVSHQIFNAVGLFANNFYMAVKPSIIKNYSAGNYDYVQKMLTFSSKAMFIMLYVVILPFIICVNEVLQIWLGKIGPYMSIFAQLSLIYTLILTISYPITAVVQASGKVKQYYLIVDGFSLTALPVIYIFFKLGYDAQWAYIVSIFIFTIAHFLRLVVLKRVFAKFDIRSYLLRFVSPAIVLTIISYIVMANIKVLLPGDLLWTIAVFFLSCILVLSLGYYALLSATEKAMIIELIKKIRIGRKKQTYLQ